MQNRQIDRLINQLVKKSAHSKDKALFIRHYDGYSIDAGCVKKIVEDAGFFCLDHEFSLYGIQSAFEPFLDWTKELYPKSGEGSIRDFLKKCRVYPLHYGILESFIETGACVRWEDILLHEISYEQTRMMKNIINIFQYMSEKKPIFLLLNRVHLAQSSSLCFLYQLISRLKECNVYIFGAYNEDYKIRPYLADDMKQFTDLLERQQLVVSMVFEERIQEYFDSDFVPEKGKLAQYAVQMNNMIETGAYRQANYYLSFILQKYQTHQIHLNDADYDVWVKICILYIRCCLYRNDISNATRVANRISAELMGTGEWQKERFMISYYIGMAQIRNANNELADQCAAACSDILKHYSDETLTMRLLILKDVNLYLGFDAKNLVADAVVTDEELIALLRKYDFSNHLSYIYTNCMTNVLNSVLNDTPKDREYYEEGLRLAEQNGNNNCVIVFYTNRVVLASSIGRFDLPEGYYKHILHLIEEDGDLRALCYNYNGMGYFTCVDGCYEKSDEYYTKALKIAYEMQDSQLVAETLYNKCITAFIARDYRNAIRYIELSIDVVERMGYMRFIANWSKLYGLAALSNFYDNNEYSCNFHFDKMRRFLSHLLDTDDESKYAFWDDDLFLFYLVSGMLEKGAEHYEQAVREMERAKKNLLRTPGFFFFGYPVLAREMADCYDRLGLEKERQDILEEAIRELAEKNYRPEIPHLRALRDREDFPLCQYAFPFDKELLREIRALYNEAAIKKSNDIFRADSEYLVSWQSVLAENKPLKEMCDNAVTVAMSHFRIDSLYMFSRKENGLKPFLESDDKCFTDDDLSVIERFAKAYSNGFVVSRFEKDYYLFESLLFIFGLNDVVSFMMTSYIRDGEVEGAAIACIDMKENLRMNNYLLDGEALNIFKVTYRQLVDFVEKEQANELVHAMNEKLRNANKKLEEIAIKDALTGIYNRQGLAAKIEELKENGTKSCGIVYFDLDNFKYYNDTFGHDVGDLILVQFARILRELAPEDGIPIRYGGDEFLLMLPGEGEEKGVTLARHFYEILERDHYYIPNIEEKLGRSVIIPDEKRISSSIGIAAAGDGAGCDINGAIMHADEALYRIKRTTKRNYITWSAILDV